MSSSTSRGRFAALTKRFSVPEPAKRETPLPMSEGCAFNHNSQLERYASTAIDPALPCHFHNFDRQIAVATGANSSCRASHRQNSSSRDCSELPKPKVTHGHSLPNEHCFGCLICNAPPSSSLACPRLLIRHALTPKVLLVVSYTA